MSPTEPEDRDQMREELWTLVGGHFSPDAVGPDRYDALIARVRERAGDYLDLAAPMLLGEVFNPWLHSELHVGRLLAVVRDVEPDRTREMAEQLLSHIDAAAADTAALSDAGPEEADRITQLLAQRHVQITDGLR